MSAVDLTLTALPRPDDWVAILGYFSGENLSPRSTLRLNDLLVKREFAHSMTGPSERERMLVGKDVTVAALYPNLWDDWTWKERIT